MSTAMKIVMDATGFCADLKDKPGRAMLLDGGDITVALLKDGMGGEGENKNHAVAIRIDLPGGEVVLAQTSLRLFVLAADSFRLRAEAQGQHFEDRP